MPFIVETLWTSQGTSMERPVAKDLFNLILGGADASRIGDKMGRVVRGPVYAICEQQTSAQSDRRNFCSPVRK